MNSGLATFSSKAVSLIESQTYLIKSEFSVYVRSLTEDQLKVSGSNSVNKYSSFDAMALREIQTAEDMRCTYLIVQYSMQLYKEAQREFQSRMHCVVNQLTSSQQVHRHPDTRRRFVRSRF